MSEDYTVLFEEWQGFYVESVSKGEGKNTIIITLKPEGLAVCRRCNRRVEKVHEYHTRLIRDLPAFESEVFLMVHTRRVSCQRCGTLTEKIPWLSPYARYTNRLADSVGRMCVFATIKDTAEYYGLSRKTVKAMDTAYLYRTVPAVNLDGIRMIAMDEFAIAKGHRYATVVIEPNRKQVLWIGRGRSRESVHPFFELLGEENCKKLRAVAMDMNSSYEQEVWEHCPNAKIVYDLFHVVAKFGREVIDRVRVDEANRLRDDKKARQVVKGSRWLLLRNKENIKKNADRIRLKELLDANKALSLVYILKDDLKQLWSFRSPWEARGFWKEWYNRAMTSNIKPLMKFAERLKLYIKGIISHSKYQLHTSVLEGINNKIKVIKRKAYGFRDDQYFFMKIKQAFPGIGT